MQGKLNFQFLTPETRPPAVIRTNVMETSSMFSAIKSLRANVNKNVITEPLFKRTSFFMRSHLAVVPFIAALISTNQIITQSVLMY